MPSDCCAAGGEAIIKVLDELLLCYATEELIEKHGGKEKTG